MRSEKHSKPPSGALRRIRRFLARAALAGALVAVVFVWWWNYSGSLIPLTERVETDAGTFTLAAALPIPRTEAGGCACGDRFYMVGGIGGFGGTFTSCLEYDPASDAWRRIADLPQPVNHPGVVAARGKVWAVGGFGPLGLRLRGFMFARWDPLTTVYVFDPATGEWTEGPPLPEPRGAGGVAATDDALWYVGGIDADRTIDAALFRLDLASGTWEPRAPMPTARDHLRLEAVGGFLYAISGREDDLRHNLATVERYDPRSDTWTRVADHPTPRGGFGSAVLGGAIYTFGGEFVWTCRDEVERYDPAADRWETVARLPEARHGICAGVIDGRVHLVSGGRHPRISVSGIHRVLTPPR